MYSASQPSRSLAMWKQSWSQLEPGKTRIPNFTRRPFLRVPSRHDSHVESLDDRVGEELFGHLPGVGLGGLRVRARDLDEEDLAGPHVRDTLVPQTAERRRDRLALRVEDAFLRVDANLDLHAKNASKPE